MRYAETTGRVFSRKSDYVNSIVRACARKLNLVLILLLDILLYLWFMFFFLIILSFGLDMFFLVCMVLVLEFIKTSRYLVPNIVQIGDLAVYFIWIRL